MATHVPGIASGSGICWVIHVLNWISNLESHCSCLVVNANTPARILSPFIDLHRLVAIGKDLFASTFAIKPHAFYVSVAITLRFLVDASFFVVT